MKNNDFDEIAEGLLGDRDVDDDGVLNMNDCRPLNPERQDLRGAFSTLASKLKTGVSSAKQKYGELKRGAEIAEEAERRKEIQKLQEEKEELERKRKLAQQKKQLEQEKQKLKEAQPKGTLEKVGEALFGSGQSAGGKASGRSIDPDDKWSVVNFSNGTIVASFQYKTDAKKYASRSQNLGVLKTSTALNRGIAPGSEAQSIDIFGGGGNSGPGDLENMVIGSPTLSFEDEEEEKKPWYEQGLV